MAVADGGERGAVLGPVDALEQELLVRGNAVDAAFDDDKAEAWMLDADARERVLLGVLGDFEPVAAVGEGVDPEDGAVDPLGGVLRLLIAEFLVRLVFGEFPRGVRVEVFLCAFGDFAVDAGFDGGGVFDGFFAQHAHQVGLFDFRGGGGFKPKSNFSLLFFEIGHAAVAAGFGLLIGSQKHRFGGRHVFLLGRFKCDRVLNVESNYGVRSVEFEAFRERNGRIIWTVDKTFIPPLNLRRWRN